MILYNITTLVDNDIETEFKEWVHRVYLVELANKKIFKSQSFLKVLDSPNEGQTFCLQMHAEAEETINFFKQNELPLIKNKIEEIWSNKVYIFESKMQYIAIY